MGMRRGRARTNRVGLESIPGTKHDAQILVVLGNYKPEI